MKKTAQDFLREIQKEEEKKKRGVLKIFFGYASGVGKTYSMLENAHAMKARGVDVVLGYIEPHSRKETMALCDGIEALALKEVHHQGIVLRDFNLDAALRRKPQLILVDEFAHQNAPTLRHKKRYRDIEELLAHGINVYTTVNVQHLESLNDLVSSVTGISVRERIPDYVFDNAEHVELVDIEPQELLDRLKAGKVYKANAARRAMDNFFSLDNLTALREIALRRCADRVKYRTYDQKEKVQIEEHILVCLSSAPSNQKLIRTAARMANAFQGKFTALFVQTPNFAKMSEENRKRLQKNIRLANSLGASLETVLGDDVAFQIGEFARMQGCTKVVIGRSSMKRHRLIPSAVFADRIIEAVPNIDVYIIPDLTNNSGRYREKKVREKRKIITVADTAKTLLILILASLVGFVFDRLGFTEANIITVYIISVLIVSVTTGHRIYSFLSSLVSVLVFNFFYTTPRYSLESYASGYPVTFIIMFCAAMFASSLAIRLKKNAEQSAMAAYRTKILFESNQLFQKMTHRNEIIEAMAVQLNKLFERDVIVYMVEDGKLTKPKFFSADENTDSSIYTTKNEKTVAKWVMNNNKHAGATTDTLSNAKMLYLSIRVNDAVYGVVGIAVEGNALDSYENSILISILGECALALENEKNVRQKHEAAMLIRNGQLKNNLLLAFSHDLSKPVDSIGKNAKKLLETCHDPQQSQAVNSIYNESLWLDGMLRNIRSVEDNASGEISLTLRNENLKAIIEQALFHIDSDAADHEIICDVDEGLYVKADGRLLMQVILNLLDNAVRYTPKGSCIRINAQKYEKEILISISDNGPGIEDGMKEHIFDMFYFAQDGRHPVGGGLHLCQSIIDAHSSTLTVQDNEPHGSVFSFRLKKANI